MEGGLVKPDGYGLVCLFNDLRKNGRRLYVTMDTKVVYKDKIPWSLCERITKSDEELMHYFVKMNDKGLDDVEFTVEFERLKGSRYMTNMPFENPPCPNLKTGFEVSTNPTHPKS